MEHLSVTHKMLILIIPIAVSLSSLVMGYFIVYFTMLEESIQNYHQYSDHELEIYFTVTYTVLPVGAFISAFFYDAFLTHYGENKLLRILDCVGIVAILLQFITIYTPILFVSRFLMGIFCGFTTGLVPSYILSISPSFISGIIGTFSQLFIVIGMAFAYYMGQILDNTNFKDETALRIFIGIPIICLIAHLILLYVFPFDNIERLINRRDNVTVRKYLTMVYGKKWRNFQQQIREFKMIPIKVEQPKQNEEPQQKKQQKVNWKKIKPKIFGILLAISCQATGINAILQYAKQLFMTIQNGNEAESNSSVLILGVFQVIVTLASGFLINRYGRRPMMLIGEAIVVVALFLGFIVTSLVQSHEYITIFLVFLHVLGFSISLGPMLMLYSVETLQSLRLVIIVYWGLVTLVTSFSDFLIQQMQIAYMFLIFGISSLLCFTFLYFNLIETRNVSRKKVRQMIEGDTMQWEQSVVKFKSWVESKYPPKEQTPVQV